MRCIKTLIWNIVIALLLCGIALIAAAAPANETAADREKSAQEYFEKGKELSQKGLLGEAQKNFDEAVKLNPSLLPMVHYDIALANCKKSNWAEAIREFEAALKLKPNDMMFLFNLANAYQANRQLDKSIQVYEKLIDSNKGLYWAHFNLGTLYEQTGNIDRAIEQHEKASELNPKLPIIYLNTGNLYSAKNLLDKAITAYEKVISLDPKNFQAHNNLGLMYIRKGLLDNAIEEFNKTIELNPHFDEALVNLGSVYMYRKDPVNAIPMFQKALEINPSIPQGLINIAVAYRDTNQFALAMQYAEKARLAGVKSADDLIVSIVEKETGK
ncbi:MAG: tetratricopeptide repeat protein [Pseudomonadota bacterium]